MVDVIVTDHAHDRLKERLGLPRSARQRMAQRAFDEGTTHAATAGRTRSFLDKCYLSHRKANNLRVYSEHVWIFCGRVLVTIYNMPHACKAGRR